MRVNLDPLGVEPFCSLGSNLPVCSVAIFIALGPAVGDSTKSVPFPSTHRRFSSQPSASLSFAIFPPDLPTGSTASASLEATGDSLHLALVLRESRFGELAITLTELALRETSGTSMDDLKWTI